MLFNVRISTIAQAGGQVHKAQMDYSTGSLDTYMFRHCINAVSEGACAQEERTKGRTAFSHLLSTINGLQDNFIKEIVPSNNDVHVKSSHVTFSFLP